VAGDETLEVLLRLRCRLGFAAAVDAEEFVRFICRYTEMSQNRRMVVLDEIFAKQVDDECVRNAVAETELPLNVMASAVMAENTTRRVAVHAIHLHGEHLAPL